MGKALRYRLSLMMFFEFFIWGSWYVTVGNYMRNVGMGQHIYWAYTVAPFAAVVAPFFLGMVADRLFATQKVYGFLHGLGGVFILLAPIVASNSQGSSVPFITVLLLHNLCYTPTISLANALAFHHVADRERDFPIVRALGSVGWIVAGVIVSGWLRADETEIPFYIAAGVSFALCAYSYTLPHTPPRSAGKEKSFRQIIGMDAWKLFKTPSYVVFILCALFMSIPLSTYNVYTPVFVNEQGIAQPAFVMSFGQMTEVVIMFMMPFFFARLGIKKMMLIGMSAWVIRYTLFSLAASDQVFSLIMAGILLHGIGFDFFFIAGQVFVDRLASDDIRAQAHGITVMATFGIGTMTGSQVSGWVFNAVVGEGGTPAAWEMFWIYPAVGAGIMMVVFSILFKNPFKPVE